MGFLEPSRERIPNGHSFNVLHMEGIAGELKTAGITQNEIKSGEECAIFVGLLVSVAPLADVGR